MTEFTLDLLQMLGAWSLPHLWVPLAAWTLVALPVYWLLERRHSLHPLVQQRARQALLVALPLGLAAAAVLALVPGAQPGAALPTLLFLPALPVSAPAPVEPPSSLHFTVMHVLGLATLAAGLPALVQLGRLALHAAALRRFRRALPTSSALDAAVQRCAGDFATNFDIRRRVRVVCTDRRVVPMTFGLIRPVIVLPETLVENDERLDMTLAHEMVHIRRLDYLAHGVERVLAALFVVHPLVGRLHRSAAAWRERACDAAVLEEWHVRPRRYAALLRDLALTPASRQAATLALTEDAHHLKSRLEAMKDYTRSARRFLSPKRTGLLLGALLLILATGIVACTELVDANEPTASNAVTAAQATTNGEVFMAVEEMPEIVGGMQALYEIVEYPAFARKAGIEGTVYVQFTVNERGEVANAAVVRGVHELLDAEALRAVKQLEFKPGRTESGEKVKVRMSIPITFKLPGKSDSLASAERDAFDEQVSVQRTNGDIFMAVEDMPDIVGGMQSVYEAINYPAFARKAGIEGTVYVQFTIDEEGNVINPVIVRGVHELLNQAALEAVRSLEFKPGRQDGEPVRVRLSMPITFKLPDGEAGATGSLRDKAGIDPVYHRVFDTLEEQSLLANIVAVDVDTRGGESVIRVQTEPGTPETVKAKIRKQIQRRATRRDVDLRVVVE